MQPPFVTGAASKAVRNHEGDCYDAIREHRHFARRATDAAFGRSKDMNFLMVFVLGLLSRKMNHHAKKRGAEYSFLFVHPDGRQLAEIGELLEVGSIRPVIDKVFPFDQAKEALAYLEKGRAKGKVVVQME